MPPLIARQCTPPNRPASSAPPSTSRSTGIALALQRVVVGKDVQRRGLDVLELAAAHRPGEGEHGDGKQHQRDRDEGDEVGHGKRPARSALSVTPSEEPAMPRAAQPGAISPLAASAIAAAL